MIANKRWLVILLSGLLLLTSITTSVAAPCCIIVVPPAPPPPEDQEIIYPLLPLFAAVREGIFSNPLEVKILTQEFGQGVETVASTQGALGIAPLVILAAHKAKRDAPLEVIAVINSAAYDLYTRRDGPKTVKELKGKKIAFTSEGSLAHLFVVEALRNSGVDEKEVTFVIVEGPGALPNLLNGNVDAVPLFIDPLPSYLPLKKIQLPRSIKLPAWVLYASSATLDKELEQVAQFTKGLTQGIEILRTQPNVTREILETNFKITNRSEQDVVQKNIPIFLARSIEPDPKKIEQTLYSLGEIGKFTAFGLVSENRVKGLSGFGAYTLEHP